MGSIQRFTSTVNIWYKVVSGFHSSLKTYKESLIFKYVFKADISPQAFRHFSLWIFKAVLHQLNKQQRAAVEWWVLGIILKVSLYRHQWSNCFAGCTQQCSWWRVAFLTKRWLQLLYAMLYTCILFLIKLIRMKTCIFLIKINPNFGRKLHLHTMACYMKLFLLV